MADSARNGLVLTSRDRRYGLVTTSVRSMASSAGPQLKPTVGTKTQVKLKAKTAPPPSEGADAALKPKPMTTLTKKQMASKMFNLYDNYLLDWMNLAMLKEGKTMLQHDHMEAGITAYVELLCSSHEVVKVHTNKVLLFICEDLKKSKLLYGVFDDLVDAIGKKALDEITNLLAKKFEKISVKGSTVNKPVFQNVEIAKILDCFKSHISQSKDPKILQGYIQDFNEKLSKLAFITEKTLKENRMIRVENNIVLEHCSLNICSLARDLYQGVENDDEEEEEESNEDKNKKRAQLLVD